MPVSIFISKNYSGVQRCMCVCVGVCGCAYVRETLRETRRQLRDVACVNICSNSVMTVCPVFCLCVYNESALIGQVDVVNNGGSGST